MQYELDNYESLHPGYDEYRFDLDEIGHDPYVLTSILSALHEGVYTLGDVQGDLAMLFEKQYTLTQTIETETRYGKPADFNKLDHNREAGNRAFILNIGKIAPFNTHHFSQRFTRQMFCFPCGFYIRAESFKTGAIFYFRHITSPIYIV